MGQFPNEDLKCDSFLTKSEVVPKNVGISEFCIMADSQLQNVINSKKDTMMNNKITKFFERKKEKVDRNNMMFVSQDNFCERIKKIKLFERNKEKN